MKAIEFETTINHGVIHIPTYLKEFSDTPAKVIIMYEDQADTNLGNKLAFLTLIEDAQKKDIFKDIEDSVDWQKKLRDEWE